MLNSIISDAYKGAIYCTVDIKKFYLNNPMSTFRYMRIPLKYITQEIVAEYGINSLASNGYVHVDICKGIYGLKEAGNIAYNAWL